MSWSSVVCVLAIPAVVFVAMLPANAVPASAAPATAAGKLEKVRVYVGTYTGKGSKGIYRLDLDLATGKLSNLELAAESTNPSFLAINPSERAVYAVNEIDNFGGKKAGAISAFAIDARTGNLTNINQQTSGGPGPCHLIVDKSGKRVLCANYGGGSVEVIPIDLRGRLVEPSSFVQHKGKSADPARQEGPHGHSINVDAANRFAVVCDLGLDKVLVYRFDPEKGTLTPNDPPGYDCKPGSGPRHFAFHPDGKHAYAINELACTITAFDYDADKGVLKEIQAISTLPEGVKKEKNYSTAEVQVHPSGKFLYGSNRGHNTIAAFAIDADTGKLTLVGHQGKGIKTPRGFGMDPTGTFMLVGNQDGGSVVEFRIDPKTGELKETGITAEIDSPVCVKMIPLAE
jgi:6-phosphogluconolactonase